MSLKEHKMLRKQRIFKGIIVKAIFCCLTTSFLMIAQSGCMQAHRGGDVIFQVSTLHALLEGVYDGEIVFKDLKQYGDLGIGTFNALDGEMIGLGGRFYQIKADGKVYSVDDSMKTPFAVVTFFEPDRTFAVKELMNFNQLKENLDGLLMSRNIPYAFKIDGMFKYVKTRSVPRQKKPYLRLVDVVKKQPTFEFHDIRGTIVGFRVPKYMEGINVPGYHFHFITEDRTSGGHLLECILRDVKVEIDPCFKLLMVLPERSNFLRANLSEKKQGEIDSVEKGASH